MDSLQAIILGAVQGLTEFVPISSSAHLIILPWLLDWKTPGLIFDVSLHVGTLLALLSYFWREWYDMIKAYLGTTRLARSPGAITPALPEKDGMLLWPLILACVPAVLAGMALEGVVEHSFRHPALIGVSMIVLAVFLLIADRVGEKTRPMHGVTARDWIIIGLAQALAIIPGVSRSGVTITAGLFCGLKREASARFSFLIGAPIILGAAVYKLRELFTVGIPADEVLPFLLGVLTATFVGYLCIGFLIAYLQKRSTGLFVVYRLLFGLGAILLYGLRGV